MFAFDCKVVVCSQWWFSGKETLLPKQEQVHPGSGEIAFEKEIATHSTTLAKEIPLDRRACSPCGKVKESDMTW